MYVRCAVVGAGRAALQRVVADPSALAATWLNPGYGFDMHVPDPAGQQTWQETMTRVLESSAWAHGVADRLPTHPEVAAVDRQLAHQLPGELARSVFSPNLAYQQLRDVPVLRPESVVTHMAARPAAVRSWSSAVEWLPELAELLEASQLSIELTGRPAAVRARTGYLLQQLRPDLATMIRDLGAPRSTTWFGPRETLRRHDST